MAEHPTPEGILQLGLGFWGSKTLLSAVELGVFAELGKGPVDTDDLVQRIGLHRRSARDFLDSLVALGMLRREGDLYSNTAETELFLDPSKPTYVGGILGDGQRAAVRFLEVIDRGAAQRLTTKRGEIGRELLRRSVQQPGRSAELPGGYDIP